MNKNILIMICMVLFSVSFVLAAGNFNLSSSAGPLIFGNGTSGLVGIGTSSPDYDLEVESTISPFIVSHDTTASIKTFMVSGDAAGYMGTLSNHHLRIQANNTDVISVLNTGNVGIGTSSPSYKLHINESEDTVIQGWSNEDGRGMTLTTPNASDDNSPWIWQTGNSFKWMVDAVEALFIQADGRVGIGTDSPSQVLDVVGGIQIGNTAVDEAGAIRWTGTEFQCYNGSAWNSFGSSGSAASLWSQSGTDAYYNDGNVGIGTDSPSVKLDIRNGGSFNPNTNYSAYIGTYANVGSGYGSGSGLLVQAGWDTNNEAVIAQFSALAGGYVEVPRMTIKSNGKVGIGTSSPAEKLHVNGSNVLIESGATGSNNLLTLDAKGTSSENNIYFAEDGVDKWSVGTLDSNQNFRVVDRLNGYVPFQIEQGAGDNAFYVDNDSNVGIGTSSPYSKLDILEDGTNAVAVRGETTKSDGNTNAFEGRATTPNTGDNRAFYANAGNTGAGNAYSLYAPAGTLYNEGNVGIGTSSPQTKLEIEVNEATTSSGMLRLDQAGAGDATMAFAITGVKAWAVGIDNSDADKFKIGGDNVIGTDTKLTIQSDGNVGIGTTSPNFTLDIAGEVRSTAGNGFRISQSGESVIHRYEGSTYYLLFSDTETGTWNTLRPFSMAYATGDVKIGNTALYVEHEGNVGIGTSSPSAKLDVEVSSGGAATIGSSLNSATGDYAVAMGYNTNASGLYSTAMGHSTTASGKQSTAMGYDTTASGISSIAMGSSTTASANQATAMGYATTASANQATAMGYDTTASGTASTAMGREIQAGADYVVAIGLADMNGLNCNQANSMCIMGGDVGIGTSSPSEKLEVNGRIKDETGFVQPVGAITMYGAATAPTGWVNCDGASLLRAGTYADLFAVIGVTYGSADGTHFNVPNFNDKFPRGNTAGATGGSDTHTHTGAAHSHELSNAGGAAISAGGAFVHFKTTNLGPSYTFEDRIRGTLDSGSGSYGSAPLVGNTDSATPGATGSGSTLPAYTGVNFIIKY